MVHNFVHLLEGKLAVRDPLHLLTSMVLHGYNNKQSERLNRLQESFWQKAGIVHLAVSH